MRILSEAEKKEFMTKKEQALKKRLIALLKDDGRGHKHAKYAARLADFDIKIVPLDLEPRTAAISFDKGIIYINEGFLSDPATFYQLNVLMRHEMAHNLLMHQVRLAHKIERKYGKTGATRIKLSSSLHGLMNIIEDFEISNTRYTDKDKQIVRNMYLNGELIGGLVTEDMRKNWEKLPLEQMYDELSKEIAELQKQIIDDWNSYGHLNIPQARDMLDYETKKTYYYADTRAPSGFLNKISDFMRGKGLYHFKAFDQGNRLCIAKFSVLPPEWQTLLEKLYAAFSPDDISQADIELRINELSHSSPMEEVDILSPDGSGEVLEVAYTPEEKLLATDLLKSLKAEKTHKNMSWKEKVKKALSHYPRKDVQVIFDGVNAKHGAK